MENVNRGCEPDPPGDASVADQQHLRDSEGVGVSDGEQRGSRAHRGKAPGCAAVKPQLWRTASSDDLEIAPEDLLRVSRPKRLHAGFLRRKSRRKMNRGSAPTVAVGDFTVGEEASYEAFAIALDKRGDAWNLGGVEAKANDVRHVQPSSA